MVADSMDAHEQRKQFFNKIDSITRGYELKKQTPHWFDHDQPIGESITIERSDEYKQEQLADKKLYTIYKIVEEVYTPVAWNVPRIEKDAMLTSVFKPRRKRVFREDDVDSVIIDFKAFSNDDMLPFRSCESIDK